MKAITEGPVGNKAIDFEMTLDLVAWKDGGADVYGKYGGDGIPDTTFKAEYSDGTGDGGE